MLLEGSCHCGAVQFSLESTHACPFNLCYCSVCRKTAGGGGFAINLGADYQSLKIRGEDQLGVYQVTLTDADTGEKSLSPAQRNFCRNCASALWVFDPRWPNLVHPFASAIDTALPIPPEHTHLMLTSKANWVEPCRHDRDQYFDDYPDESIAAWHQRLDLEDHG